MLTAEQIEDAIEIQEKAYKLLLWVAEAIDRRIITFTQVHHYASAPEAARQWVEDHYENFPNDARVDRSRLREFANYFAAYVTSSFDLIEVPGQRFVYPCGCSCSLCGYLVNASHLKTKSPAGRDKKKAERVCAARVEMLAQEEGLHLTAERAAEIASSERHRRSAAYSAYLHSVLDRMQGDDGGVHVLSLWRMIAWKPEGSPIKKFRLNVKDAVRAEQDLIAEILSGE